MDLLQIVGDLLLLTVLGILVAFNPMLVIVDILLVLRSRRPILNTIILTAGFATSIFLLFIIAGLVIDPDSQISLRKLNDKINIPPLIDIFAGSLLLIYALARYRRQNAADSRKKPAFKIPTRPYQLFVFAFVKTLLSVTNIFAILILANLAATNNWNTATGFVAVFWLLVVGVVPLATIVYYHQFKHESLVSIDKRLNDLMSRDSDKLITYVLGSIATFFIVSGLITLIRS